MIAKIWKKMLLAVCIIAVLFDITAKLVNRISLEKAISSSPEGVNIKEVLNITDEQKTTTEVTKQETSTSKYKTIEEVEAERKATEEKNNVQEVQQQEASQENENEEIFSEEVVEEESSEKTTGGQIIEQVTDTIKNAKESVSAFY